MEELFEHDPVVHGLTGGDLDGGDAAADLRMPEDLVGARGLLDPVGVEFGERVDPVDRLAGLPLLVRVDGDADIGAHGLAGERKPAPIVLEAAADLELDLREPLGDGLLRQPHELLVVVAEPAGRGRVRGEAGGLEGGDALGETRFSRAEDLKRLLFGQGVADVGEVDRGDEVLGGQFGEVSPQRFARTPGRHVPQGTDEGARGHLRHPLLGSEPAQLRIVDEQRRGGSEVGEEIVEFAADEQGRVRLDRGDDEFVAASGGEHEPMTHLGGIALTGTDGDVGGRVVGVDIDGIGAVELERGGESDVGGADVGDERHGIAVFLCGGETDGSKSRTATGWASLRGTLTRGSPGARAATG
ncbi:Uncharacterised protein [Mycobacteroides abscessus subsp. abscessus]|nr:Uncharacterised protein [Mycobacteroides abscessus subsp. abscessus]